MLFPHSRVIPTPEFRNWRTSRLTPSCVPLFSPSGIHPPSVFYCTSYTRSTPALVRVFRTARRYPEFSMINHFHQGKGCLPARAVRCFPAQHLSTLKKHAKGELACRAAGCAEKAALWELPPSRPPSSTPTSIPDQYGKAVGRRAAPHNNQSRYGG